MPSINQKMNIQDDYKNLQDIIDELAKVLPSQGPISVFVHHNPLHAFENQTIEEASLLAAKKLGCEAFKSEDWYRAEFKRGRINAKDVGSILNSDLGSQASQPICGQITKYDLRMRLVINGFPDVDGQALAWLMSETSALEHFRRDIPDDAIESMPLFNHAVGTDNHRDEFNHVAALWSACKRVIERSNWIQDSESNKIPKGIRHRDLVFSAFQIDIDEWINALFIRFIAGYLDQDYAQSEMPYRAQGIYQCFLKIYCSNLVRFSAPWGGLLLANIRDDIDNNRHALNSVQNSLFELGIARDEVEEFLEAEVIALRGWAGMVGQIEERPDRVPSRVVPAKLVDFIAVRLLFTRAAVSYAAKNTVKWRGPLRDLRSYLLPLWKGEKQKTELERAWPLFHIFQLFGLSPKIVDDLNSQEILILENEVYCFNSLARRSVLQRAYERHLRNRFYDSLAGNSSKKQSTPSLFQAVFCIDDREESFRRHLEEVEPNAETFGSAGFFGVPIYFKGARDAHPRPLCPIAIQPQHYIEEVPIYVNKLKFFSQRLKDRVFGIISKNVHYGSRTFMKGSVLMASVGVLSIIPLVLRILFPRFLQWISKKDLTLKKTTPTRLKIKRRPRGLPPIGNFNGFTTDEMTEIVSGLFCSSGIYQNLSTLVFFVGHGSTSINNPYESAYDCGACGGGHGGPNARAIAIMANDPDVRLKLSERGFNIPPTTWFLAAERNTGNNTLTYYDERRGPARFRSQIIRAKKIMELACGREAQERCRRFKSASIQITEQEALAHVEARSSDLAQPRPEYCHATNAFCVVGNRSRTKGLFLDRRAFLVSYDQSSDPNGKVLERLILGFLPVVVGINLEYYFGAIDPTGYGSGTKLPHNVVSLLGIMNGTQSDLCTGLPLQTLELHEPVRLSIVFECTKAILLEILHNNKYFFRLVFNEWIFIACIDPNSNELFEFHREEFKRYKPEHPLQTITGTSSTYFGGKRGHLPFVAIDSKKMDQKTL